MNRPDFRRPWPGITGRNWLDGILVIAVLVVLVLVIVASGSGQADASACQASGGHLEFSRATGLRCLTT
jgi:hypothetical protein